MFLSNPQPFTAAVTHKSYFNHSMQKAASAYEAREKICGKASCMACSRAEITAQLQARGPRGRETLPDQAKQQDDRESTERKCKGKHLKGGGTREVNPFSTFAATSLDCPDRDFCLVIGKEMSNRRVMSTKYHLCWWTGAAMETLKEQGGGKRENFKHKRATAGYQLSCSSTKREIIFEVF